MPAFSNQRRIETEAQQSYRFYLKINDLPAAYISNVTRPTYVVSTQAYKLLNHYFNHPTEIKWNPITFTIREIFSRNVHNSVGGVLINKLKDLAYDYPTSIDETLLKDLSKDDLARSLGPVKIQMLNPEGEIYEEWSLKGAFITQVNSTQLDYAQDGLTGITVTVQYDWAELKFHGKQ